MITTGFRIAWRHARKFKIYSLINIGGLALGFASSIAILHFVSGEFSYDKFHRLSDNVYRLNTVTQTPTGSQVQAAGTPLLAPTLISDIPEVEAAVRLRHADDVLIEIGEKKFYETKVFYADSNFFNVLTFPLAQGNPHTALKEINTAVITTAFAKKYFGNQDPINKTIKVNDIVVQVSGVTLPAGKSHLDFDVLVSFETFTPPKGIPISLTSWAWTSFPTYVRLREGTDKASVEAKFPAFIRKYRSPEDARKINYQLQPVKDVYLHSRNILERDGISTKGDYTYTVGLAAIAALIMGIACFNFANLSTALSIYRVKETGVKRSLGSSRSEIFSQFIFESIVGAAISLLLGIIMLQVGIAQLENLFGTDLSLTISTHIKWLPLYIVLIFFIGSLGGLYPALFLSRLKPQLALKATNAFHQRSGKLSFKKVIIVFQFFVTALLIAGSLSIKRQIDFVRSKDLGYNKDGIIVLHVPDEQMRKLYASLRNKLSANAHVLGVSASRDLFDGQQGITEVEEIGRSEDPRMISMFRMYPNFVETMGIEMALGRTFTEPLRDSSSFILNEAAVEMLGWDKKEVIGKKIRSYSQTGEVIGVVKDFHFTSLHATIAPLIMLVPKSKIEYLYVRVAPGDLAKTLPSLEADWKAVAPHLPFEFIMLDEHVGQMYRQDERLSQLILVFCGLSVFLAFLGLYGVISLMAEARTKEIGIRKVLGASVSAITAMLSGEFMLLVFIAVLIALPTSYYFLEQWLNNFAYRINMPIDILMLSVLLSAVLAGLAVSFRSIKAALANPIDSIKSE
ncbi:ABC transporter permease [Chryseolinea soli]|uniref:FtsX-like permease family protein n=1 Tax=Chryseolinea soli TaxID=2321403 RepID=A0A385SSL7_9BACT|nr:ABC transporter permease [Chryseolinea soli]AYB33536.1 FtsX-like permease family protein [Chryseolinea soli]